MNTRLTQKLSSFGLKHYQIIACFFGNIFCVMVDFHGEEQNEQQKMFSIFFHWLMQTAARV